MDFSNMSIDELLKYMNDVDKSIRFKANYWYCIRRFKELDETLNTWDTLEFKPVCPFRELNWQLHNLLGLIKILEIRAKIEDIDL